MFRLQFLCTHLRTKYLKAVASGCYSKSREPDTHDICSAIFHKVKDGSVTSCLISPHTPNPFKMGSTLKRKTFLFILEKIPFYKGLKPILTELPPLKSASLKPDENQTYSIRIQHVLLATTSENIRSDMCAQHRFQSACPFTQSDQNIVKPP